MSMSFIDSHWRRRFLSLFCLIVAMNDHFKACFSISMVMGILHLFPSAKQEKLSTSHCSYLLPPSRHVRPLCCSERGPGEERGWKKREGEKKLADRYINSRNTETQTGTWMEKHVNKRKHGCEDGRDDITLLVKGWIPEMLKGCFCVKLQNHLRVSQLDVLTLYIFLHLTTVYSCTFGR